MKKILSMMSILTFTTISTSTIIACNNDDDKGSISLSDVISSEPIRGEEENGRISITNKIIKESENKIQVSDLVISAFKRATFEEAGYITFRAVKYSPYSGEVTKKIAGLSRQIDIRNTLSLNPKMLKNEDDNNITMTEKLKENIVAYTFSSSHPILKEDVKILFYWKDGDEKAWYANVWGIGKIFIGHLRIEGEVYE